MTRKTKGSKRPDTTDQTIRKLFPKRVIDRAKESAEEGSKKPRKQRES
jgi:hypothetical protein